MLLHYLQQQFSCAQGSKLNSLNDRVDQRAASKGRYIHRAQFKCSSAALLTESALPPQKYKQPSEKSCRRLQKHLLLLPYWLDDRKGKHQAKDGLIRRGTGALLQWVKESNVCRMTLEKKNGLSLTHLFLSRKRFPPRICHKHLLQAWLLILERNSLKILGTFVSLIQRKGEGEE